ncbi:MAG: 3-methyl-2-oxobutanoate dehydrogenase subunit VorB [Candidatus Omnitrophota bacterium]
MKKILITGNEAIAEAAIQAGCRFYAGYPITPQNEIPAYMAAHMPGVGGVFIQAESELAAINMVFGAAAIGARAITSSSSPGISLKQEGISYLAGCELPAVIVNIMRGGPGLGNISPAQSDYFQATKGGGHGDYHCIVLAPSTVQEAFDLTRLSFDLADKYRMPVIILGDGMLGQMMEPIKMRDSTTLKLRRAGEGRETRNGKKWALTGAKNRKPRIIRSLYLAEGKLEEINIGLQNKYTGITKDEQRYEGLFLDESEIILVSYGMMSRIAKAAVIELRKKGKKIGFIRPITLWPFPNKVFKPLIINHKLLTILVIEMSCGQMVEDVKLAVNGKAKIEFLGRAGGGIPTQEEIIKKVVGLTG